MRILPDMRRFATVLRSPELGVRRGLTAGILRAATLIAGASVVVKLVAMSKEMVVAAYFGRGDLVDAFLFAYLIPGFLVVLFASSLNAALIPTLVRVRETRGKEGESHLFSQAFLITQSGLLILCSILAVIGPNLLGHMAFRFTPDKLLLTQHLFWAMLPTVLLTGLATNCASLLNTFGSFALPAATPVITPVMGFVFLLTHAKDWGIWSLVAGVVAGSLCEAAILVVALHRRGFRFCLKWNRNDPDLTAVRNQYLTVCGAGLLSSGAGLLDQSMAAWLPVGSVAALAYGGRIVGAVVALISTSASTSLMPFYSEAIARGDWTGCRESMRKVSRVLFAITIPVTVILVTSSGVVVRALYQRGAFTPTDTAIVASVQAMYALQLPFYGVAPVYLRFLVALRRNDLIMVSAAINLALDFILNLVCMRFWGVAGLALSTSLFYAASFVFLRFWAQRLLRRHEDLFAAGTIPQQLATVVKHG